MLPAAQARLVDDLKATGKPVIVVVIAGRPLVMNKQLDEANAALMAFLPGTEGGSAIASALFGEPQPERQAHGVVAEVVDQFPLAYNEAGAPYDPRYRFGYGLSYSRFDVSRLKADSEVDADDEFDLKLKLENEGERDGEHTVLPFVERTGVRRRPPAGGVERQEVDDGSTGRSTSSSTLPRSRSTRASASVVPQARTGSSSETRAGRSRSTKTGKAGPRARRAPAHPTDHGWYRGRGIRGAESRLGLTGAGSRELPQSSSARSSSRPARAAAKQRVIIKPKPGQEVTQHPVRVVVRAGPESGDLHARLNGVSIGRHFLVRRRGIRVLNVSNSYGLRHGAQRAQGGRALEAGGR